MEMIINDQTNIQDKNLLESLIRYSEIKQTVSKCTDNEILIDLSRIKWAFPLFLNLLILLRHEDRRIRFINETSYLNAISYPNAIAAEHLSESNIKKTYIPLVTCIPGKDKDASSSIVAKMIALIGQTTQAPKTITNGIRYMLQEIVDNVEEHSKADTFYILAQAYQKKNIIDICIADNGEGVKQSYEKAGIKVKDDLAAIKYLASAVSSKDRPENESRGYGLFTSRKITTEGLEGEFLCISGKAAYAKICDREFILDMPSCNVKGTVVALRLKYDKNNFNLYKYLEY